MEACAFRPDEDPAEHACKPPRSLQEPGDHRAARRMLMMHHCMNAKIDESRAPMSPDQAAPASVPARGSAFATLGSLFAAFLAVPYLALVVLN